MNRIHNREKAKIVSILGISLLLLFPSVFSAYAVEKTKNTIDLTTAIVQVAKKNIPAVVNIEVTGQQEVVVPSFPFESDPFFNFFFGTPRAPKKYKKELKGMGTGMIIDQQGHILTNYHVVGGASKIEVQLSNGNKYIAKLVGTDPKTDLAVIKISAKERLTHVTFGNSDKVEVGEWVVAIGHPRGLNQTVTQGIISAKHRQGITDPTGYEDFLQTDAAINPGNSGGPLLNLQGEVIGVNAAIISGSGGYEGIGFAIPSKIATHVAERIISHGKVERGWIGVTVRDLTPEQAKVFKMEAPKGAYIEDTIKGGPADKAGIKKGDIITHFQGKEVLNSTSFRNEVSLYPIGSNVTLTVLRDGKKTDFTLKIGNPQEMAKISTMSAKERLGIEVRKVRDKEAARYGLVKDQGVAVSKVYENGPAAKIGLEPGDIILEINGRVVEGVKGFNELMATIGQKQQINILAIDYRTGNMGYVKIP